MRRGHERGGAHALRCQTATAPGLAAAYHPVFPVAAGTASRGRDLALGAGGITLRGSVRAADGRPATGALVRALRESDVQGDIFVTTTDANGAYALERGAGPDGARRVRCHAMGRGKVSTPPRDGTQDDGHGPADERLDKPTLAVERDGFNVHAGVRIEAGDERRGKNRVMTGIEFMATLAGDARGPKRRSIQR